MQAEDELQLREVGHHLHDRKLGGAGIAEKMRDPLVHEQLQEGGASVEAGHQAGLPAV